MKVMVSVSFDSRLIPPSQLQSPKRWRALSALRADPLQVTQAWAQQAGLSFPIQLGSIKTLMSFDPDHWAIAIEHHRTSIAPRLPTQLSPLKGPEVEEALSSTPLHEVTQALTRCAAVHAAEHLEGLSVEGKLHERWRELCLWVSHVALLKIDLKRSSTVHNVHRQHLRRLEERWSLFHPEHLSTPPSARAAKATLSNLEHLPHLGTLGSALGARVALTAQLFFSLNALGQWFWIWVNQSPELLTELQAELSVKLRDTPYHPKLWRALPNLSSTVLELYRLYPPEWCLSTPLTEGPLIRQLLHRQELNGVLSARRAPTFLLLPSYWRQRDERVWEDAERFNPRRHLALFNADDHALSSSDTLKLELSPTLNSIKGQLIFHAFLALLTSLLRRGVYRIDESVARAISARPPALQGGALCPSGEALCRFETAEHVAYIRSTRV